MFPPAHSDGRRSCSRISWRCFSNICGSGASRKRVETGRTDGRRCRASFSPSADPLREYPRLLQCSFEPGKVVSSLCFSRIC